MSKLHSPLWLVGLLALSFPPNLAWAASRPLNLSWEVETEARYVGEAETHGGRRIGSFEEWAARLNGVVSLQMTKDHLLRIGAEWQRISFGVSDDAAVPHVLQKLSGLIGLNYQLNDQWLLSADVQPGIYSDFEEVSWRDVDAPLLMGAAYLANADLQWFFGVRVDLRSQYPVLPALGVRWRFADEWTLNLLLPSPRLEYELNDRLKAFLGLGVDFGTFRVSDDFGTERGRLELNHAPLDYSEIRVGPGFSWKMFSRAALEAEAGYMIYRRFDFFDQDLVMRSEPAPFVRVACQIRF